MKYKFLFFLFILSFYISNSYSQTIAYANFDKIVEVSPDRLGKDQAYLLDSNKLRNSFILFSQSMLG